MVNLVTSSLVVLPFALLIGIINLEHPTLSRKFVEMGFSKFDDGVLCLKFPDNSLQAYGDLPASVEQGGTVGEGLCDNTMIIVKPEECFVSLTHGSIGIGQAYHDGLWTIDHETQDLGDLLTHIFWNVNKRYSLPRVAFTYLSWFDWKRYINRRFFEAKTVSKDQEDGGSFFSCTLCTHPDGSSHATNEKKPQFRTITSRRSFMNPS